MELALEFIQSMKVKLISEQRGTFKAIEHRIFGGAAHSRVETILFNIPDSRDRDKEFERGLVMTRDEAYQHIKDAFDIILQYLEQLKSEPEQLMSQPFLHLPPLTYSQVNNETTALNLMMAMFREVHYHTGQIIYIAKMRKGELTWD